MKAYTKLSFDNSIQWNNQEGENLHDFINHLLEIPNRPKLYIGLAAEGCQICYAEISRNNIVMRYLIR